MPRKPRFDLPDIPVHVVQRGNNRQPVFFDDAGRRAYLAWLGEAAGRYGCAVHAYVLMTNHVHLLMTPARAGAVGRTLQYVGRRYVPYVNRMTGRTGTLWEGRYRANLIEAERYLLLCHRYIELNPVRAGLAAAPVDYVWSSYAANALGEKDPLVTPHPVYLALGRGPKTRRKAYAALFAETLPEDPVDDLLAAVHSGTPLGGEAFCNRIEAALRQPVGHARRGRPRKPGVNAGRENGTDPN